MGIGRICWDKKKIVSENKTTKPRNNPSEGSERPLQ